MKWDDFVGKPRPNRVGKKLGAFNALFQVFSREKSQAPVGALVVPAGDDDDDHKESEGENEEEAATVIEDLTVTFEENLFLSENDEEDEEYDRPATPPAKALNNGDAPPSSKLEPFVIEERKELLSGVSWNTHSFRFLNRPEQRMGMARVLCNYDLVLLQEIPCGEKARESLEYFCSIMNPGGTNPFDFLSSETLSASSSSLNAILFRQSEWHVVHATLLSHHLHLWLRC